MAARATVVRLRDNATVDNSRGALALSTFADLKRSVDPHLVDACTSTLSRPTLAASTTTIQAECWAVLLGPQPSRDIVGVSPTGSGKTLAFLLPAFAWLLQSHPEQGAEAAAYREAGRG